jgi:uroporphyrinogen decarboxylase
MRAPTNIGATAPPEGLKAADGVHSLVPRERMSEGARKLRDAYAVTPGAPFYRREFGYYCLERWKEQGMPQDVPRSELFQYDPPGCHGVGQLGWCEAAFVPAFEEEVIEDRGGHEVVRDCAGRHVLCFKGRRSGFMPEYLDHPVKDVRTWEEDVKWRLDPDAPGRFADIEGQMAKARAAAAGGMIISQRVIGGYMYLRSLVGPEALLYAFYDMPEVIHDCMRAWLALAVTVTARHQEHVTFDEVFFGEDICYNHGPLISPDMIREFVFPYYQELLASVRRRQIDRGRRLHVQVDTDGFAVPVIELYHDAIGLDVMCPFEVAAGCDVVEVGRAYPWLVISGGVDKRVLARGPDAIDRELERVFPAMRERGGYVPTCDHGVPEEVRYADYLHYRRRAVELGG